MRIAAYGGSFHPPHVGHALVASWLKWTDQADRVWLVPTASHPFSKDLAPFADRVDWCRALAADIGPFVEVCELESELPAPSYTIATLKELRRRYPEHTFRLVIGADVARETPMWKAWDEIAREFSPIVVGRQGHPTPDGAIDFPGVSSTEVRRRLAAGEPVGHLLTASVLARIRGNR